jgi:hypothetical protein
MITGAHTYEKSHKTKNLIFTGRTEVIKCYNVQKLIY